MNYTTKKLPKSQIEFLVTVPHEELKPFLEKAAVFISEEKSVEGFRPGKAPYEIIKQKFGEYAIYEKAAKNFIMKKYPEILSEFEGGKWKVESGMNFEFIGQPEISIIKLAPSSDFEFKIMLSILPELKLPEYKKIAKVIAKERKTPEVSEKEIEDTLTFIKESRASLITVSRPAEIGDAVEIDLETFDDITKLNEFESKSHPLILGDKKNLPGIEENLIGMKAGESKEFTVKLPENFRENSANGQPGENVSPLAGKTVTFKAKMNLVQNRVIPELTDEFAKGLGNFSGMENLRKNIYEGLFMEKDRKEKDRTRIKIVDEIAAKTTAEIPEILINAELEKMVAELKNGVERMGLKFDEYLSNLKKTPGDLKLDWVKDAERRVKISLILREIAKQESIEPSEAEIREEADKFIMQSGLKPGEIKKIDKQQIFDYAYGIARNEKVFKFLEKQI